MKKSVTQKDSCGCGLACVAFVTGKTYVDIRAQVSVEQAKYQGFQLMELRRILNRHGFRTRQGYAKRNKNKIYQEGTIVFIRSSAKYPMGHYLVRYHKRWMDPWINLPLDGRISNAKSGYRKRLPGQPIYAIFVEPI